jgi:hypothetical protein
MIEHIIEYISSWWRQHIVDDCPLEFDEGDG